MLEKTAKIQEYDSKVTEILFLWYRHSASGRRQAIFAL